MTKIATNISKKYNGYDEVYLYVVIRIKNPQFSQTENKVFQSGLLLINRCFDKILTTLKLTQSRIETIIEEVEDNWIIYETLMHHKNAINSQINTIIGRKRDLIKN